MSVSGFSLASLYSQGSIHKLSKALGYRPLLIRHTDVPLIYSNDLYNTLSDSEDEERSFVTDPFLIPDIDTAKPVMLFTPAASNKSPILPDGSRNKMFVFRGFWKIERDADYVATKADWEMMSPLARAKITQLYGGRDRSTRIELRESYLTRFKLTKAVVYPPADCDDATSWSVNDNLTDEPGIYPEIHIGDEEGHERIYFDSYEGLKIISLRKVLAKATHSSLEFLLDHLMNLGSYVSRSHSHLRLKDTAHGIVL
ncbi:hypothetical protein F5878DRAFT_713702 [Lentinula raphanica]|uniref:Uncharacterized protein n=1 Tax=Lentinula raphanica TaxID=153919 RepID=A0AA38NXL5_9AGAR|nr:hypothetical protein F5878DRAFT_713702 [Lentinula raphanica]